jgi:hypothetical protein
MGFMLRPLAVTGDPQATAKAGPGVGFSLPPLAQATDRAAEPYWRGPRSSRIDEMRTGGAR